MCHQFYLTRRITTRRGANFWPRKRTQETHKQTQNSSQEHSHHIWKWLEVIYLPRLSLLADSTHFLLCVVFVVSLFEQQVAAEYRVPWCSGRHCIKLFMAMSKIQKGAPLTRENSNIRACELNLRHLTTTHSSRFIISTLFSACSFFKSVFCI